MKIFKFIAVTLTFCFLQLLTNCKKNIHQEEFTKSEYPFSILGMQSEVPDKVFKRQGGGLILLYERYVNGREFDCQTGIVNDGGVFTQVSSFGGTRLEIINDYKMDSKGSIYLTGRTNSPDLRMDKYKNDIDAFDAYLAKVDKDGNLLWQRSYCDTSAGNEGAFDDEFFQIVLLDDKVYCFGRTSNYQTPSAFASYDNMMAVFDVNGKLLFKRLLPSKYLPLHFGAYTMLASSLPSNEMLIYWVYSTYFQAPPSGYDTTAALMRYNPTNDSILWVQYYIKNTPEGDAFNPTIGKDGNLVALTADNKQVVKLDANNGKVLSVHPVDLDPKHSIHFIHSSGRGILINDNLYFVGVADNGYTFTQLGRGSLVDFRTSNPYMVKVNAQGEAVFAKDFNEIPNAFFSSIIPYKNKLTLVGAKYLFNGVDITQIMVSTDENGNLILPK